MLSAGTTGGGAQQSFLSRVGGGVSNKTGCHNPISLFLALTAPLGNCANSLSFSANVFARIFSLEMALYRHI